jgi:uncharacterized damage-inducible protein DinB
MDAKAVLTEEERATAIRDLEDAPARLRKAVEDLDEAQLDTPYREGGWTVRQVVHHMADSHLNGYVRMRWMLTEDVPLLKTYDQPSWAELDDARVAPVAMSLDLFQALHRRWMELIRSLTEEDLSRRGRHPEAGELTVDSLLGVYAWHTRHHTAHITRLRERKGW